MKQLITEERNIETNHVGIEDLVIKILEREDLRGEHKPKIEHLNLDISNYPEQGCAILNFGKGGIATFKITLADGLISFERHVSRPAHDHDSTEALLCNSKGELFWSADHPDEQRGEKVFTVRLGGITDKYPLT